MIIDIDKNVLITIVFIILFSTILYVKKPSVMFDSSGDFKHFGTNEEQTLYPIWLVVMISSIVLYVFLITKNNKFV
jgi:Na+/H+ antiporter NhaC